ncbi:RidA family protein [Marinomonas transparens]|uniref:RidA family protein n=1 Tax=Marinomonas transparens TaxID=2795388 RepID=A0A934JP03_9GAMM|nr:RidA family protein [Marinomonas transparens]MBJ7537078.1 RidA family protein [Marinomonas transparens]
MCIERLNPSTMPNSEAIGYSQISIVDPGRMAYVSGQVATRPNSDEIPSDLHSQMEIVSENIKEALTAVGASPKDIVQARVYAVDLNPDKMEILMPVLLSIFEGEKPCITGVGVQALASPEFLVEMEMVVSLPNV